MALTNPGLGARLAELLGIIREREVNASDNGMQLAHTKGVLSTAAEGLCTALWREDEGRSALDYDDEGRTVGENLLKRRVVYLANGLFRLLNDVPVREYPEAAELGELVEALCTDEDRSWQPQMVKLGNDEGVTVECRRTSAGVAVFDLAEGQVEANVYKARDPDVVLGGVAVYLVQRLDTEGQLVEEYVVMVDDEYWGRRIQPEAFQEAPFAETFVMGYRLRGQILHDGVPQEGANVSFEVVLDTAADGEVIVWDSEEYNELVYSPSLETYVEGPTVLTPVRTGTDGWCEYIVPRGDGAIYQRPDDRRDDTEQTRLEPLTRSVAEVRLVYRGRKAVVAEGSPAVINICSGKLNITGTPSAWVRVGPLDDAGELYQVPPPGQLELSGLVQGEYSIVQFKRTAGGAWDAEWGCPRVIAEVKMGETASVDLPPMEHYEGLNRVCGRVYERPGVPAVGIEVVVIDMEMAELVGVAAVTDEDGFWSVTIPPEGLGGELYIHDPQWGSLPVLGMPYSDVVLGARACSAWQEMFKPQAWRKGSLGHSNFQYVPGAIRVTDLEAEEEFATTEAAYGGWVTVEPLPAYAYVGDIGDLLINGPRLRHYRIMCGDEVVDPDFTVRFQPFEGADTIPGRYRAAAYQPEKKILMGSKIHGNVVRGRWERIGVELPEAARVGLEYGAHQPYAECRIVGLESGKWSGVGDWLCPYCGGPAERDPGAEVPRGFCRQCAEIFGYGKAMDCRSYFRSPTMPAGEGRRSGLRVVTRERGQEVSREVKYHWRPELYDETEFFLTQDGPGQPTNAPRWVARHVDEVDDGRGFGQFDGDLEAPYIPGHEMSYFEALPFIDRSLGLAQLKLVFAAGYTVPQDFVVEIDCIRGDAEIETVTVAVKAGLKGPTEENPFGDVVLADIRLVEPATAEGCKFTVVGDAPFLQSSEGVMLKECASTPVAIQLGNIWGQPHVFEDDVGQLFMFFVRDGDIWFSKRAGLAAGWQTPRRVTSDASSAYPWADKDGSGRLILVRQRGSRTVVAWSRDDGDAWEEV